MSEAFDRLRRQSNQEGGSRISMSPVLVKAFMDLFNGRLDELEGAEPVQAVPPWGRLSLASAETTMIADADTWTKLAGATLLGSGASMFEMPENGRLRYTGDGEVQVRVLAQVRLEAAQDDQYFGVVVTKNGAINLTFSEYRLHVPLAAQPLSATMVVDVPMGKDDYLELFVQNIGSDENVTARTLYLSAIGHPKPE